MDGAIAREEFRVGGCGFGIGRDRAVDAETPGNGVLDVAEESDAGSGEERRAERGVSGGGDRDRAVEDVRDDFAPEFRPGAAADEEDALHGKAHFLEGAVAVAQRERHALHEGAREVAAGR